MQEAVIEVPELEAPEVLLNPEPYVVPARDDGYNGDFWKYHWHTTRKNEQTRISESDPTVTESIQLRNATPFSIERIEPTPVRYILKEGVYYRSLNGADALPAKTLMVRLRYLHADGEVIEGSKQWLTRVGLYVMHSQMLQKQWQIIEVIPVSYERSQPTEEENIEFCRKMLFGDRPVVEQTVGAVDDKPSTTIQTQRVERRAARHYKSCKQCGARFLAKRSNQEFDSRPCFRRWNHLQRKLGRPAVVLESANTEKSFLQAA